MYRVMAKSASRAARIIQMLMRIRCKMGLEGIVSKRLGSPYRSGRSRHWAKSKNPKHPAVKREAEEDWGK
jgi:ATP-dependent DNA ligase